MKKTTLVLKLVFCSVLGLTAMSTAHATSVAATAAEISISGKNMGADANAVKQVRQMLGNAFTQGAIDKVIITGYGYEGGFMACIEASPQDGTKFLNFLSRLRATRYNKATTDFQITGLGSCPQ